MTMFLYGALAGMGISWIVTYQLKRHRILEKVRLNLLSWLYDDPSGMAAWTDGNSSNDDDGSGDVRLVDKYRTPIKVDQLPGTPIPQPDHPTGENRTMMGENVDFCGSQCDLVTPDWTLTRNLYVDTVTLASGAELLCKPADGVEYFYVIKGDGTLVRNSNKNNDDDDDNVCTETRISTGMGFIVDPGCHRGFKTRGITAGNLVLLRATDAAAATTSASHSAIRPNSSLSSTVNMVSAGLGRLQTMVESYRTDTGPHSKIGGSGKNTVEQ